MLRDRILCSHIEVKTATNGEAEGRTQLALWCAAGFEKLDTLWTDMHDDDESPPTDFAPMPMWLWLGRNLQLFIAFKKGSDINVLLEREWFLDDWTAVLDAVTKIANVMD